MATESEEAAYRKVAAEKLARQRYDARAEVFEILDADNGKFVTIGTQIIGLAGAVGHEDPVKISRELDDIADAMGRHLATIAAWLDDPERLHL
jgi:hypothetical protein